MPSRLAVAALLAVPLAAPAADGTPPSPKVKLAVLVVFDQMRGDYPGRWQPLFGPDGFKRLQTGGAWYTDCHYPYATTSTGPGHASLLTGAVPAKHGIVNNEWYDARAAAQVYCAGEDRYTIVPAKDADALPAPPAAKEDQTKRKPKAAGSPARLLSPGIADVLREAYPGKSRVFGLSLKDRSAIFPTGHRPDGAYWFDGRFVTSTYYRDALPKWVEAYNANGKADYWFGRTWDKLRPDVDYEAFSGPDKAAGEANRGKLGTTFPHPITGGLDKPGKEYYEALATTPFGNDLLLDFAKACIVEEKLGKGEAPDLLTVSFSSNDLIGHAYGPDSQEVLDVTLRSDALMADLLKFLDETVGKGKYSVCVSADHGICPLPEFSAPRGKDAKRVSAAALIAGGERHLRDAFGKPDEDGTKGKLWVESLAAPWVYLNERLCTAKGIQKAEAAKTLADWLRQQPNVFKAYTRAELDGDALDADPVGKQVRLSYHPARSGDVYIVLKPYHLNSGPTDTGTNHGTPHEYDTHVPLLVYGPGVPGGVRGERVTPQALAPIFGYFLGVNPPKDAVYPLPATLFPKP